MHSTMVTVGVTIPLYQRNRIAAAGCLQTFSSRGNELHLYAIEWQESPDLAASGPASPCRHLPPGLSHCPPACRPLPAGRAAAPGPGRASTRLHAHTPSPARSILLTSSLHRGSARSVLSPTRAGAFPSSGISRAPRRQPLPGGRLRRPCPSDPCPVHRQPRLEPLLPPAVALSALFRADPPR